tara:strand:+ start:250 stop:453 length:204 start_codon:yes stop_codon:yes gene_type:complete
MAEPIKTNYSKEDIKLLKDYSIPDYKLALILNRTQEAIWMKRSRMKAARRLVDEMDLIRDPLSPPKS